MKLHTLVTQYIVYRKSLGEHFKSNETRLKFFVHSMGSNKNLSDIRANDVGVFLNGKAPLTGYWHAKHQSLRGFYRYAISRGYTKVSPLPKSIPKIPRTFIPYIYNVEELNALLEASQTYQKFPHRSEPYMVRTLLLLLYGAGLRISEAINLKLSDVDLSQGLLIIRETKFYKTRLVPLGTQLTQRLSLYVLWRQQNGYSKDSETPFFIRRDGKAVYKDSFERDFRRIRKIAGIKRTGRLQPRLHDLRHTFAVHRLTQWYKEGADVQKWLPVLSVYLGHVTLASTSIYLTMTPTLLEEAGHRFEQYAFKEASHD